MLTKIFAAKWCYQATMSLIQHQSSTQASADLLVTTLQGINIQKASTKYNKKHCTVKIFKNFTYRVENLTEHHQNKSGEGNPMMHISKK